MYFFSNSPVKCLFTNVVFPVPPSPHNINLYSAIGLEMILNLGFVALVFLYMFFFSL